MRVSYTLMASAFVAIAIVSHSLRLRAETNEKAISAATSVVGGRGTQQVQAPAGLTSLNALQVQSLRKQALDGSVEAQTTLAQYFERKKHYSEAIRFYTLAANQGAAQAQFSLGIIYEEGRGGIKRDLAYALSWYEEAARNGLKNAIERLRTMADDQ